MICYYYIVVILWKHEIKDSVNFKIAIFHVSLPFLSSPIDMITNIDPKTNPGFDSRKTFLLCIYYEVPKSILTSKSGDLVQYYSRGFREPAILFNSSVYRKENMEGPRRVVSIICSCTCITKLHRHVYTDSTLSKSFMLHQYGTTIANLSTPAFRYCWIHQH